MDKVCEPYMAKQSPIGMLTELFGRGKGSGAALLFFVIGVIGVVICLAFSLILRKYKWSEQDDTKQSET